MAAEKKNGLNKSKLKTIEKLKEKGFDTANKIKTLDGRSILKNDLITDMENIFDLQDAIKANHGELAWLMDGEDQKPEKKEVSKDVHEDVGYSSESEGSYSYGN